MARLPRVYVEGALYYITCRSAHGEKLFQEKKDYTMYVDLLMRHRDEFKFSLYAYVLLADHLHLLIEPAADTPISEVMRSLNTGYSKYFNSTYQRRGHLFRERFKATIVEKDPYLLPLIAHIHRNPQRLGLTSPGTEYPYCSSYLYICNDSRYQEVTGALSRLDGKTFSDYGDGLEGQSAELRKGLQRGGIVGSKAFKQRVNEEVAKNKEKPLASEEDGQTVRRGLRVGVLLLMTAAAVGVLFWNLRISRGSVAVPADTAAHVESKKALDNTEWELWCVSGKQEPHSFADKVTFARGTFVSAKYSAQGFAATNYSETQEGDAIMWETIQVSGPHQASWRGEFKNDRMEGALSLRSGDGSIQDYSFISIKYRRKQ